MVDLNDVGLFVRVVRAGSFAEAGRQLGLPPNTVSRRVQLLEHELGLRLMQRSTRRLTLTDAGRRFFAQCADQIESLAQSAQELAEGSHVPSGKVRVAAPADFFNWFPFTSIARFLALHPKVRLEFELNDARADLLGEGIDVAFRAGKTIEPNLIARQVGSSRASLVASPGYLKARGVPRSLADLAEHDCITLPTNASGGATWRLDGPDGPVEVSVTGRFHANHVHAHVGAAVAGLGIALMPTMMIAEHERAGRLLEVLPGYGLDRHGVYFVYVSRRHQPLAVSALMEFMSAEMVAHGMVQDLGEKPRKPAKASAQ